MQPYSMQCINCNKEHNEKFCPNCGEKSAVARITISSIIKNAASTIFNMDKGYLYNLKKMTLDPHAIVNDYLRGKRKGIYNPIAFLLISVTIYIVVDAYYYVPTENNRVDSPIYTVGFEAAIFVKKYFKFFWILSIVWLAISTRMLFKKFNFAEHLAISAFVVGFATLIGLIGFFMFNLDILYNPFIYLTVWWLLFHIFKTKKNNKTFEVVAIAFTSTLLFFILLNMVVASIGLLTVFV